MRQSRNGSPSPRWPRMNFSFGCLSNTPESTRRIASVAVSTVKPQAARSSTGKSLAYSL